MAVNLWGLDSIKTKGESVAIVLAMVGARPVKEGTGRIARFELIPLEGAWPRLSPAGPMPVHWPGRPALGCFPSACAPLVHFLPLVFVLDCNFYALPHLGAWPLSLPQPFPC